MYDKQNIVENLSNIIAVLDSDEECGLESKAKNTKLTLNDCKKFAELKEGKCLSTKYNNINAKMLWRCKDGHVWEARFNDLKRRDTWCPYCSRNNPRGEQVVRNILEYLFDTPFPRKRPRWLINPKTGQRLELDCFNESLKFAVEHNGPQHTRKLSYMPEGKLEDIKFRDKIKKKFCKENKIKLLIANWFDHIKMNNKDYFYYIIGLLQKNNVKILKHKLSNVNIEKFFIMRQPNMVEREIEIAKKSSLFFLGIKKENGTFDLIWGGARKKHWYKCVKCSHTYEKTPQGNKSGCPICAKRRKNTYTYTEAKKAAKKLNIIGYNEYRKEYKKDPRLPAAPEVHYKKEWVSWYDFLWGVERYQTYKESKKAIKNLNITSHAEYRKRYKENPKLPSNPYHFYKNKGWVSYNDLLEKEDF